jgi:hypothetical protein
MASTISSFFSGCPSKRVDFPNSLTTSSQGARFPSLSFLNHSKLSITRCAILSRHLRHIVRLDRHYTKTLQWLSCLQAHDLAVKAESYIQTRFVLLVLGLQTARCYRTMAGHAFNAEPAQLQITGCFGWSLDVVSRRNAKSFDVVLCSCIEHVGSRVQKRLSQGQCSRRVVTRIQAVGSEIGGGLEAGLLWFFG